VSGDQFLQHDAAVAMAKAIVEIFRPFRRPEEYQDAFDEVYAAVKAGLQAYVLRHAHLERRLKPLSNGAVKGICP
jgi:hypothetical protein